MAFDKSELSQMEHLARTANLNVLIGALCVAGIDIVTDMTSDMLRDADFVREEGIPSLAKISNQALDQVIVVFPDMVADGDELDDEPPKNENETPFEHIIRCFMTQILKQRPELAKLEFQPR